MREVLRTKPEIFRANIARNFFNFLAFGLTFSTTLYLAFSPLLEYNKSNLWLRDGINQHYPNLYFFHQWMSAFLSNISQGPTQWSWNLGLGADVISTMSWPIIGDPFALLSLLFPLSRLETASMYMYFARLLVAGVVSYLFMRKVGARPVAATVGTLVYIFTTFTFFQTMKHGYFANVLVFLPLVLWGIERFLRDRKYFLLVFAVCFTAYSNFYFFYMISIFAVLYFLFRYFELSSSPNRLKNFIKTSAKFVSFYTLGTLLAAPVLLPSIVALFSTGRVESSSFDPTYSPVYYFKVLSEISMVDASGTGVNQGLSAVALALIPVIFVRRRQFLTLKAFLVLIPLFIAFPIFGSIFNGFSYPTGRFTFVSGLIVGLVLAMLMSSDDEFRQIDFIAMIGGIVSYFVLVAILKIEILPNMGTSLFIGAITIALLALKRIASSGRNENQERISLFQDWKMPFINWAVLGLVVLNVFMSSQFFFGVKYENSLVEWADLGQIKNVYQENPVNLAKEIKDKNFYRVDSQAYADGFSAMQAHGNDPLVVGYRGDSLYASMINGRLSEFMKDIENRSAMMSFSYTGFDDRAAILSLLGVKYYISVPEYESFVPFGFNATEYGIVNVLHKNNYSVGLGFVYDKVMKHSEFLKLNSLQRQQALLSSAVIANEQKTNFTEYTDSSVILDLPFEIVSTRNTAISNNEIFVSGSDSNIRLKVPTAYYSELYISFKNYQFEPQDLAERAQIELGPQPTKIQLDAFYSENEQSLNEGRIYNRFRVNSVGKRSYVFLEDSNYEWGNANQLVNLGFYNYTPKVITLGFGHPGTVKFDDLHIYAVPMATYASQLEALRSDRLTHIQLSKDHVSARINSSKSGILYLNIPYSDGWKIKVDGKPVKSFVVNTAFTGINLTAGKHSIEMDYTTPGLRSGVELAIFSLVILTLTVLFPRVLRFRKRFIVKEPVED
ncbi:MAG: hypothetical protein RL228_478 [Actinomycetota bacterium]